jgi:hypothetical protein
VPRLSRAVGLLAATALVLPTTAVLAPAPAGAADGQVCTTGPAPTPATAPWLEFVQANTGSTWTAVPAFQNLLADLPAQLAPLGPSSTQAQIDEVEERVGGMVELFMARVQYGGYLDFTIATQELLASLELVAPGSVPAAQAVLDGGSDTILEPAFATFSAGGAMDTFIDTLTTSLDGTAPLPGPVSVPSSAAAAASLPAVASAVDQFFALGKAQVVYSGTASTCVTTATLSVPGATTTFGKATTVTIGAAKNGAAMPGELVVLLDGEQIGAAHQQSSYVANVPATLAAGKHVLTVAFAPADGSPIATRSSVVTVGKATTKTTLKVKKGKATITVAVPGTTLKATGKAGIKVGKQTFDAKLKNGKGTVKLGKLKPGTYKLKAVYAGTDAFAGSSSKAVKTKIG